MNTCKCGHVVYRAGTRCMSCAKKTAWKAGTYDDVRERLRTLRSGRVDRLSTQPNDYPPVYPRSKIDNALRDAFRTIIGFDPLYDRNPAWKFPREIIEENRHVV